MTLVEVLIVLGIVALLLGLIVPAIVRQRELARRSGCNYSLKVLSLAIANYESAENAIPPGWMSSTQFGWNAILTHYLDSGPLQRLLDFSLPWTTDTRLPPEVIRAFRCPADSGSNTVNGPMLAVTAGRSNYPAVSGATLITNRTVVVTETQGAFGENSVRNFRRDFKDGLSNTFLLGERTSSGGPPHNPGGDTIWAGIRDNHTQQGQALVIGDCSSSNLPNFRGANRSAVTGFSSFHAGGVNFLMADCSVKFISEKIDPSTYANLATLDDGNVLGNF